VRRKIDGKETSKSFRLKREAWDYYGNLVKARNDGLEFDATTGEPSKWLVTEHSVAEWAAEWLVLRGRALKPRTRASYIEALAEVLPYLTHARAAQLGPEQLTNLRAEIRGWFMGTNSDMPAHLRRYSLNLRDLDSSKACQRADTAIQTGRHGRPRGNQTIRRYRATLNTLLNDAVERGLLDSNPWPKSRARTVLERTNLDGRVTNLPSDETVRATIERLASRTGRQIPAIVILCRLSFEAGLRPAEARALHIEDLRLPRTGWGDINVVRSANDGPKALLEGVDDFGPTKTGATRRVPIGPELVAALRDHIGPKASGLVAEGQNGKPVSHSTWTRAWLKARQDLNCTIYELRHACATRWLKKAGIASIAELARRLGHSPEVLLSIYVGVVDGDEEHVNQLLAS
jgi:integrase